MVFHIRGFQEAARGKLHSLNIVEGRGGAVNGGTAAVLVTTCGNRSGNIGRNKADSVLIHIAVDCIQIQRQPFIIRNADGQHTGAKAGHRVGDGAGSAVYQTDQNHQCHNTDDNTQHGQGCTHFVGTDGPKCHFE